jgi:hypothetical protein
MRLTSNSSIDRIIQKQDTFVNHESNQLFIKVKYSKIDQRGSSTTLVAESNPLNNSCPLTYFLMIKDFAISSLPCVLNLKLTPETYALTVDGE